MLALSIIIIALGVAVLAFGKRLVLISAKLGVILGIGSLRVLPGGREIPLWLLLPVGLAVLFSLGANLARHFI